MNSIAFRRAAGAHLGIAAVLVAGCAGSDDGRSVPRLAAATPASLSGTCEALAPKLIGLGNTSIGATTTVTAGTLTLAGQDIPEHCRVTGKMFERVSPVDGKTYSIQFEMRLPKAWNGRFLHQGNGGIDGSVVTAQGNFGGGPVTNALLQGFAVLSSDAGHTLAQGGPAFGIDPQARLDYGYQAVAKLTPVAKSIVNAAYGKGPDRSYFAGCSNGGRHTLVTAARLPDEYDGYLAGAPGYNLPLAAVANIFGAQRYATVATGDPKTAAGLETAFTQAERTLLSNAVLGKCDALDGATDGLVQDTNACQAVFNFQTEVPTCIGARNGSCLSAAQKTAIAPIFSGATTSDGKPFYASFPFDSGHGSPGVAAWEFTNSLNTDRDPGAVGMIFKVPPVSPAGFDGPAFTLNANIDTLVAQIAATNDLYTESSLSFMRPPNAGDMSKVRDRGAKIHDLSRRERCDLLGQRHRGAVQELARRQRRRCDRFRALLSRAGHGALLGRACHRSVRHAHAAGDLDRTRRGAESGDRESAGRRQSGRRERRSTRELGRRPHAAAVPIPASRALQRQRQHRGRKQLQLPVKAAACGAVGRKASAFELSDADSAGHRSSGVDFLQQPDQCARLGRAEPMRDVCFQLCRRGLGRPHQRAARIGQVQASGAPVAWMRLALDQCALFQRVHDAHQVGRQYVQCAAQTT